MIWEEILLEYKPGINNQPCAQQSRNHLNWYILSFQKPEH